MKKIKVYHTGFLHEHDANDISIRVTAKNGVDYGIYVYSEKGYLCGNTVIHFLKQLDPAKFGCNTKQVYFKYLKTARNHAEIINQLLIQGEIEKL